MKERLQKLISSSGLTSRREAEKWILGGRVTIQGRVATLGEKALLSEVCVDGIPLPQEETRHYLMLNKPRGYVTTLSDEKNRPTVADLVADCGHRLWPVGRLDFQSEGLLFLTDDGDMTHKILHPSHEVEKEYLVWVSGEIETALPLLSAPMELDGEVLAPAKVHLFHKTQELHRISVIITQGKNRQIRRMCAEVGLRVHRLKRIREGDVSLDPQLKVGKWRWLREDEVIQLQKKCKEREGATI